MSAPAPVVDIVLRRAEDRDVAAIAAIYADHVLTGLASFEVVPPDAVEIARRRADVLARGLPYLVAELAGAVVGYAYAAPYRLRPAYRYTVENSVYVHRDALGCGVGRRLLERLIADCAAAGYRRMIAVIGDSANRPSIALHEACGFARAGLLPSVGFKFGRWVDSVLMQRALGPGDATPPAERG
jgi:phosphinothricin acetyltransferase